jgi:CRP/FNR family transcriptional regulator
MEARRNTGDAINGSPRRYGDPGRGDLLPILRRLGHAHQLVPGERLRRDTSADRHLYLIESGGIKLSLVMPNGAELIAGLFFEGDTLGLQGLNDAPDDDMATAFEPTRVRVLPLTMLKELGRHDARLQRQIFRLASQRIAQLQRRMLVVARSGAFERVAGFLVELENRRASIDDVMHLPLSLNDIGCYLCLSLETVSRSLSQLEREGVIRKRGRSVQVLDRERLVALAGEAGFFENSRHGNS